MPTTDRLNCYTIALTIPKITKTPPTMPQRLIRNLLSELLVFVICIVNGLNSICICRYWWLM